PGRERPQAVGGGHAAGHLRGGPRRPARPAGALTGENADPGTGAGTGREPVRRAVEGAEAPTGRGERRAAGAGPAGAAVSGRRPGEAKPNQTGRGTELTRGRP